MTHTLHRVGNEDSLKKDIVFLMLPAHRFNDVDIPAAEFGAKLRRFMEIGLEHGCISIGNASTGNTYTLGSNEAVLDSTTENATVHCVFDSEEKAVEMMKALKEADIGLSVVVSGLFDMLGECCHASGLTPHTVEYSLGVWGNTSLLPDKPILEINTMCGHGMVSVGRIQDVIKKIKAGKMTCEDGGKELGKTCTCGIFNWKRAGEILQRITAE